ncbi:putative wall-associated receptor kinase-like 16 [Zingiber officinale]|nr:putative wall-associated receptor kinase-like 16 [Zingiber officinale]
MSLLLSQMLLLLLLLAVASAVPDGGCLTKCGDVEIPYPFGIGAIIADCSGEDCFLNSTETAIGANCSLGGGFNLTCNTMKSGLKKPFYHEIEVLDISLVMGQVRMLNRISSSCYDPNYNNVTYSNWWLDMEDTPYRFSNLRNKFTAIGCDTLAYIQDHHGNNSYFSGCVSACNDEQSIINDSCSGMGCCQTSIPKNLQYYGVSFDGNFNNSNTWRFGRCNYAALLEADWFQFQTSYITTSQLMQINGDGRVPVVMDWAIGNETCEVTKRNPITSYACISNNSVCVDSSNGPGYLCNCSTGYRGNPYVSNGCQDVDECNQQSNPCSDGICQNLPGNYSCHCPEGTHGDAYNGTCIPESQKRNSLFLGVILGASIGTSLLLSCITLVIVGKKWKQRNQQKIKKRNFLRNHGLLLQQLISTSDHVEERTNIFSLEDIEKATNNFDEARVLGRGGHGTVYKGILSDQRVIAIKKSKIVKTSEIDQFINEVAILSQLNHRNIVKLLGCCLETEVPLLIYEFISNGTLSDHLHVSQDESKLSWDDRLRIALESAGALAYLHSAASMSIFHRDVKSSNILLDDTFKAKISDFGASRFIPLDQTHIVTAIHGTFGYIDPEYYQTSQLTEKSDVYSFGIILLELLTGKKPIFSTKNGLQQNLAMNFLQATRENVLLDLIEDRVLQEGTKQEFLEISSLIEICLNLKGAKRPTMKEVEYKLQSMRKVRMKKKRVCILEGNEDAECLLSMSSHSSSQLVDEISQGNSRNYSFEKELMWSQNYPR